MSSLNLRISLFEELRVLQYSCPFHFVFAILLYYIAERSEGHGPEVYIRLVVATAIFT